MKYLLMLFLSCVTAHAQINSDQPSVEVVGAVELAKPAVSALVQATGITFEWTAYSAPSTIAGFKLYASQVSGLYSASAAATITDPLAVTATIAKPVPGLWFYVLRAYTPGATPIESDNSNEVSVTIKPEPVTGLRIANLSTRSLGSSSVEIAWETNFPACGIVAFAKYGSTWQTRYEPTLTLDHRFTLTGLTAGERYFFGAISFSEARELAVGSGQFTPQ